MDSRQILHRTLRLSLTSGIFALLSAPAFAAGGGGEVAPVMELGMNMHSGDTGKSITGSNGYTATFRAEKRKGTFRPEAAADFEYAKGQASIGANTPDFTLFGAAFDLGFHLFVFKEGRFQPFIGGNGVFAWNYLKLPTPPTGVEPYTQGTSYGFEATAGVDMRFGSADGDALRLKSSFWSLTSTLAGVSGFQMSGFRFSVGMVY